VPAVRDADPARVVHEPVQLQLPDLPAAPADPQVVSAVRVVAVVSGHVQGVGYRWFVRERARAAGLAGSARNLPDGRVEVVLEGAEGDVRALVAALDGPDAPGTVTGVAHRVEEPRGSSGFSTA
jgi:acylphosphatase